MATTNKLSSAPPASMQLVFCAAFSALISLSCLPARAQQAETTVFQSKRTAHKVSGWEHGLIKKSPNLSNYYWTPLTEYSQKKGSRRTGKGVNSAAPERQLTRHYVKPRFAPLPKNDRAEFAAGETVETRSDVSAELSFDKAKKQLASRRAADSANECSGVLTYGDKEKGDGYSYKQQALSVTGRLYGQKKKSLEQ